MVGSSFRGMFTKYARPFLSVILALTILLPSKLSKETDEKLIGELVLSVIIAFIFPVLFYATKPTLINRNVAIIMVFIVCNYKLECKFLI